MLSRYPAVCLLGLSVVLVACQRTRNSDAALVAQLERIGMKRLPKPVTTGPISSTAAPSQPISLAPGEGFSSTVGIPFRGGTTTLRVRIPDDATMTGWHIEAKEEGTHHFSACPTNNTPVARCDIQWSWWRDVGVLESDPGYGGGKLYRADFFNESDDRTRVARFTVRYTRPNVP